MQQQQQWIGTTTNNAVAETKGGWDIYSGREVQNKTTGMTTRKDPCKPRHGIAPRQSMDKLCVGVYRTVRARMQGAEGGIRFAQGTHTST